LSLSLRIGEREDHKAVELELKERREMEVP
jgi:hypothetical protein